MNFLCKLYIPSVNGGMFEATFSGGDSRPDIKQKKWYNFGTVENGDPQTSFLSGFEVLFYCVDLHFFQVLQGLC